MVVISNLSEQLPCFFALSTLQSKVMPPKLVTLNTYNASDIMHFKVGFELCDLQHFPIDLLTLLILGNILGDINTLCVTE